MFTATADLMLPSTVTDLARARDGFDVSMWGRPLDTCMLDVRFRRSFRMRWRWSSVTRSAGAFDILTHGDLHLDEDMAGRAWHHYPLQGWAGFEGDYLQPEETTAPWPHYPPGTLLNEIYTGWPDRMSPTRLSTARWTIPNCGVSRRERRRSPSSSVRAGRR